MAGVKGRSGRKKGTGGRPKGSKNKVSNAKLKELAAKVGLTPLEFGMGVMANEALPMEQRMWGASLSAPYVHPRLASTETKITGSLTLEQLVASTIKPKDEAK